MYSGLAINVSRPCYFLEMAWLVGFLARGVFLLVHEFYSAQSNFTFDPQYKLE